MRYIVALDQGTTSSRAIVFDSEGRPAASHSVEFEQIYPAPGWVEHRPEDIYQSQLDALRGAVARAGIRADEIEAVGIANQRETTLIWSRKDGRAYGNAIVWQCRRTAPLVERLIAEGMGDTIRARTGLVPDAYFSGTKLQWMLNELPGARAMAERGELCFGTVDSFLTYRLTGGAAHVTDATNASRTMLFDIHKQRWDPELLAAMTIPPSVLPEVVDSAQVVGFMHKEILGREIPIAALAGDQHAALFGQGCFMPGMVKNTYGTGCFMLMNTGETPKVSRNQLLTTMAWRLGGVPTYALEGSVFVAGAAIKWLRDDLRIIESAAESETLARSIPDNANVYLVPAFTGLGAPHWDMYARGMLIGLTRGTGRAHIARAALESISYQSREVLDAMTMDSGLTPSLLRADGGASENAFLMQFQADMLGIPILRPDVFETTARGAAMLAGRAVGLWSDERLGQMSSAGIRYEPAMGAAPRDTLYRDWRRAVERARGWVQE